MQKDQNTQDQQILDYSDIEDQIDPQPKLDKQNVQIEEAQIKLRRLQSGPIQLLYIMFTLYRKQLQTIAINYGCEMRIAMNTYFVGCRNDKKESQFNQCLNKLSQFAKSINYIQLTTAPNPKDVLKYRGSPYVNSLMNSKNVSLLFFNKKVYGISRQVTKQIIKEQFNKITKKYLIFSVKFRSSLLNRPLWFYQLFAEVALYIQKIFIHYSQFFKERKIIAQLNDIRCTINMIGQRQKYLMQSKHTMKNVLESLVCIVVHNTKINQKNLKKYLQKSAAYPTHCAKYRKSNILIISKDNILKQIFKKSQNIMKHIGFDQQTKEINQDGSQREIGIYILNSTSFESKIKNVRQCIINKGFDIYTNLGVKFLQKVFKQDQPQQNKNIYQQLLVELIAAIQQKKIKYSIIQKLPQKEHISQMEKQRQNNPLKYRITDGKKGEKQLSSFFRRDVLAEKVQMKKQYLISYNVIEGAEETVYWILEKSGQVREEIKKQDLTVGRFMQGRRCTSEKGGTAEIYDQIITIL